MLFRWNQHLQNAKKKSGKGCHHFWNAIRKYGPEDFSHEVLEVCDSLEVANQAEEAWIEFYETRDPLKGFNLKRGGAHIPHPIRKNPWNDPDYRKRQRDGVTKFLREPESFEILSRGSKKAWSNPDMIMKQSELKARLSNDSNFSSRCSEALKIKYEDREYHRKVTNASRKRAQDPNFRAKLAAASKANNHWSKKTHCKRGHQLTVSNQGWRHCKTCRILLQRIRRSSPNEMPVR